jgi:hypothetical protein
MPNISYPLICFVYSGPKPQTHNGTEPLCVQQLLTEVAKKLSKEFIAILKFETNLGNEINRIIEPAFETMSTRNYQFTTLVMQSIGE